MAHRLLRLTKRSYQRPCGAGTSKSGLVKSEGANGRLGGVASHQLTGGTKSSECRSERVIDQSGAAIEHILAFRVFLEFAMRAGSLEFKLELVRAASYNLKVEL